MIRNLMIIPPGGMLMFSRQYGPNQVDQDLISGFLMALSNFSQEVKGGSMESLVMEDVRFMYSLGAHEILYVLCCDRDDLEDEVKGRLDLVQGEFNKMFDDQLENWNGNVTIFQPFNDIADEILMLPMRIVVVGEPGVGKTTILDFFPGDAILSFDEADNAIMKKQVEVEGIPNVKQIDFVKYDLENLVNEIRFHLDMLKSADVVLLVVSSGMSNVSRTKKHVEKLVKFCRKGRLVCLANMQDMKDVALEPDFIENALGLKTYPFSATQKGAKAKFFELIGNILSNVFSAEGSVDEGSTEGGDGP